MFFICVKSVYDFVVCVFMEEMGEENFVNFCFFLKIDLCIIVYVLIKKYGV